MAPNSITSMRLRDRLFLDSVEDTVDKAAGFLGSKSFPQVNGLIQGHLGGNVITVTEFKGGKTEQVPVNDSHAVQAPVLRDLFNKAINLFAMI